MSTQHTPMEIKAARALCERAADACGIDRNDNWNVYAEDFKADAKAMLDACGAPDLLEALKAARNWHNGDKWRDDSTAEQWAAWGAHRDVMDAAIAKATGAAA
jgi:DNA-binding GntR family transcriptional regulator